MYPLQNNLPHYETNYLSVYRTAGLSDGTLKDMISKLAGIPLLYQPGTRWNYSRSSDVLAYLVEVVSGKPFDAFLREKIFDPLKMEDTGYTLPVEKLNRVTAVYAYDPGGIKQIMKPDSGISAPVKFLSGNGGLYSTAKDYLIFCQLLLNKGEFNSIRILNEKTVELMTLNQIVNEKMPDDDFFGTLLSDWDSVLVLLLSKKIPMPESPVQKVHTGGQVRRIHTS